MLHYAIKILITAIIIVVVSEIGKRNSVMAAIIASLPLTTMLALIWLYIDTKDLTKVSALSWNVMIAIVPSFIFLISLPLLIKAGLNFWLALVISAILTFLGYWVYVNVFKIM
ncbi:MAG: hypothetical protein CR994_07520 [Maribacter sp.]|nr:MAG: hypothetical protein CR994_07520 [Maribacter sp.]